jgi:muconolactone delta-isomerase
MKILAVFSVLDSTDRDELQAMLRQEAAYAWGLYSQGVFRELYLRSEGPGAVAIVEASDLDEARAHVDGLPLVRAGLIEYQLIGLEPFTVFEQLFA